MEQVPALVVNESEFPYAIEDLYICSYSLFRPDPDTVCGHHGVYTRHEAQLPAPARLGGGQSQGQDGYRDSGLWNTASPGE